MFTSSCFYQRHKLLCHHTLCVPLLHRSSLIIHAIFFLMNTNGTENISPVMGCTHSNAPSSTRTTSYPCLPYQSWFAFGTSGLFLPLPSQKTARASSRSWKALSTVSRTRWVALSGGRRATRSRAVMAARPRRRDWRALVMSVSESNVKGERERGSYNET